MTTLAHGEVARGAKVALREKRLGDAWNDFRWRSQPDLTRFDAARPISMNYNEYLALFREELLYPSPYRRSLAIEDEHGRHIGNVMYYNIDALRQEAELGITIGETDCWGKGYGTEAIRLLVEHLLGKIGLRRVYLKTLEWNTRAQRSFEKAGFVVTGRVERGGNTFALMELRREWLDQPPRNEGAA
jgi:RimJ/RimL family protein N-acetyltransferase